MIHVAGAAVFRQGLITEMGLTDGVIVTQVKVVDGSCTEGANTENQCVELTENTGKPCFCSEL